MKFVLQGSPGSGKTSKLLHLALLSARKGCQVLIVGVSSRLRSVPLQHVVSTDSDEILNRIQFRWACLESFRISLCAAWYTNRYVETIDDVINVFIRLHLTNVAPHVVLVDDISTMNFRNKTCLPCTPNCRLRWHLFYAVLPPLLQCCAIH